LHVPTVPNSHVTGETDRLGLCEGVIKAAKYPNRTSVNGQDQSSQCEIIAKNGGSN